MTGRGSGSQDGGPAFSKSRRDAMISTARKAAKDLAIQAQDLDFGILKFGKSFDELAWVQSFNGGAKGRDKSATARLALVIGVGQFNTMIQQGTVLGGIVDINLLKTQAPTHYKALEKAGILKPSERTALTMINRIRNSMAHVYSNTTPEETYTAIKNFHYLLNSDLPQRLDAWLKDLGI